MDADSADGLAGRDWGGSGARAVGHKKARFSYESGRRCSVAESRWQWWGGSAGRNLGQRGFHVPTHHLGKGFVL